jgi:hypothetical protein
MHTAFQEGSRRAALPTPERTTAPVHDPETLDDRPRLGARERAAATPGRLGYNAWMRSIGAAVAWLALLAAGCGSSPHPAAAPAPAATAPAPPVIANTKRTCQDAAVGLQRGTRALRAPERDVVEPMRRLCVGDGWPAATIECFAQMHEGDFGRCAAPLSKPERQRLFDRISDGENERIAVASALVQLSTLQVGIAECDRFIETVAHVLVCDSMALDVRAQLATETADFWSLPTSGLPADAQLRMAEVCGKSTAALKQHAVDAGCAP